MIETELKFVSISGIKGVLSDNFINYFGKDDKKNIYLFKKSLEKNISLMKKIKYKLKIN